MATSENIIAWHDPLLKWHFKASEIVGAEASAEGTQGADPKRPPFGWDDPSRRWRFGASEIVGEEAAAERTQQGPASDPKRRPPLGWHEPWRLRATDIVGEEALTVGGTQKGTDPKGTPFGWHETQLRWRLGASEIVAEEASAAPKRPPPLGWPEPWRLEAAEIVRKEASDGTQNISSD